MAGRGGERVGIIYGEVDSTAFKFAASDPELKRSDYVVAEHPSGLALGQVVDVQRKSQLGFDEAVALGRHGPLVTGDQVSCKVKVIGYRDERGLLQLPRTPFKAGTEVRRAPSELLQRVLGLTAKTDDGIYLGFLKGTDFPVVLDPDVLVQKHVSVLAKTGAGKSYTVGVIIEEMLKKRIPLVIVDPHGEYGTLVSPNIEPAEIDNLIRFKLKPKSFAAAITEYALDVRLVPNAKKLVLDGANLDAAEIKDLLAGKVSSAQQGLLYQAINGLKKTKPGYQVSDVIEELQRNPSNAKWPLMAALENLQSMQLFSPSGTQVGELVSAGRAALLNLKGAPPGTQEIVVARLARALFEARKRAAIPGFLFVIEEAHNFCPERGIGHALSGDELRTIASEGRKFGMGLLIVSQRPAKVDKNVLSQCNTQIIMKVTNPNDLKAITASVEGLTTDAAEEIQRLDTGVCLVAGGHVSTPVLVEVRTRQTRHGGKSASVIVDEEEDAPLGPTPADASDIAPVQAVPEPEPFLHVQEAEEPPEPVPPVSVDRRPPESPVAKGESKRELREARPARSPTAWAPEAELPRPVTGPPLAPHAPVGDRQPVPRRAKPVPPPTPAAPLPEPPAKVAPEYEPEEVGLLRVVQRIGFSGAKNGREALSKIHELARAIPQMRPDEYVHAFARVARTFCYPAAPECGPCPLIRQCRLGMSRLAHGEVREGKWGRSAR